jgi:hypothetical protein
MKLYHWNCGPCGPVGLCGSETYRFAVPAFMVTFCSCTKICVCSLVMIKRRAKMSSVQPTSSIQSSPRKTLSPVETNALTMVCTPATSMSMSTMPIGLYVEPSAMVTTKCGAGSM